MGDYFVVCGMIYIKAATRDVNRYSRMQAACLHGFPIFMCLNENKIAACTQQSFFKH